MEQFSWSNPLLASLGAVPKLPQQSEISWDELRAKMGVQQGAIPQAPPQPQPPRAPATEKQSVQIDVKAKPQGRDALIAQLNEAFEDEKRKRQEGIDKLSAYVEAERAKENQIDFSPLAAWVDSSFGTNLQKGYERPENAQERQQRIMAMEKYLQDQKGAIADTEVNRLKAMLNADDEAARLRMMQADGRDRRFHENQALRMEDTIRKDLDKVTDAYKQREQQINMAEDFIRQGNAREVGMIVANIARNIGEQKGALSDTDIRNVIPPDIATNVSQLANFLGANEKISPQLQGALMSLVRKARENADRYQREILERKRIAYSSGMYSPLMTPGRVGSIMFEAYSSGVPQAPESASAAPVGGAGPGGLMGFEEFRKTLSQKAGK